MSIRQKLFDAAFQLVWVGDLAAYKVSKPNIDTQTVYPAKVVDELMRGVVTTQAAFDIVTTTLMLKNKGVEDEQILALIDDELEMLAKVGL